MNVQLLSDYDFEVPDFLVAKQPLAKRSDSTLLCLDKNSGALNTIKFSAVLDLLHENDILIFNDTKVVPSKLRGKNTDDRWVELLVERIVDNSYIMAKIQGVPLPIDATLTFENSDIVFVVEAVNDGLYKLRLKDNGRNIVECLEEIGELVLPAYLGRPANNCDKQRFQTIFAKHAGSVASPTAGLHFDESLMVLLRSKNIQTGFVTLHVGSASSAPVQEDMISEHLMHTEYLEVSQQLCERIKDTKKIGGRVIAVGTTTVRALETASSAGEISPYSGSTDIFIYPGYTFRCVDALITNLHPPRSTLVMLVCALGGYGNVMRAYNKAIEESLRFYTYGDAMWVG